MKCFTMSMLWWRMKDINKNNFPCIIKQIIYDTMCEDKTVETGCKRCDCWMQECIGMLCK